MDPDHATDAPDATTSRTRPPRRIEAGLERSDATALLEHTAVCVLVHDADSKDILWANPAACALLEFTLDELRPLKAHQMSASSAQYQRSIGRAWLQEAAVRGESRMVWRYRSKSGREIATDALARRVDLSDGPAVMVQFRDIEAELRMQASLARTEALFQAMARHSVTGMVVLDGQGRVEFASASALRLLDAPTVIGRPFTDLVYLQEASYPDGDGPDTETGRATTMRVRVLSSGRWLGTTMETISTNGAVQQVISMHDITELRAAEIRRARLADYENYLARYNAMGDLALTVTHELAQPLAAASNFIAGTLSRAEQLGGLPIIHDGLGMARKQIERARQVLASLRDFVAEQEHHTRRLDLNDVVEESLYFVRIRAEQAGVEVKAELSRKPLPVQCENALTGQVVLNLCFNGIDELAHDEPDPGQPPAGPTPVLHVRTRADVDADGTPIAVFEVEDHGRGIPAERAEQVFDAGITNKEHGSGIGLALNRQVIVRQRGEIRVRPAEPQGTTFSFSLPIVE